jgi:GNAT superfamily N-acetyltransferase
MVATAIARHVVWVAVSGRHLLGWLESHENRVIRLFVDPDRAGAGIGSRLLEHAERAIAAAGYPEIRVESHWSAVAFYEGRGYEALPRRTPDAPHTLKKSLGPTRRAPVRRRAGEAR